MIEAEATGARVEEGVAVYGDEVVVDQPEPKVVMTLADVAVAFGGRTAVRDVTFDVHAGEVTALIGPSGSGKTTLLRALNRMHDTVRTAAVTGTVQLLSLIHI